MNSNSDEEKFNQLYIKAMEERPEQFVPPSMPYVKCKINGIEQGKLFGFLNSEEVIEKLNKRSDGSGLLRMVRCLCKMNEIDQGMLFDFLDRADFIKILC